uniref:Uncharacterized protein n=1 Tax=uncultured marine virus TaxID=186617 RepID=A0A0F7L993_9VIRU|nr:hypothetical protein [uncultured marine virus]
MMYQMSGSLFHSRLCNTFCLYIPSGYVVLLLVLFVLLSMQILPLLDHKY